MLRSKEGAFATFNIAEIIKYNSMIAYFIITYILIILLAITLHKYKLKKKDIELNLIFNRINEAVISVDNEWKYTFLNEAALATHPFGREKTLGKVIWDVHPELVGTIFWDTYQKAMESRVFMEVESFYAAMDKWFSIKVYPSNSGLTIFYRDITEGKNIRSQLIISEKKYRTLFFKSPLPIWLYDLESLRFIDVNEAAVSHYGYSREEFLLMSIKDIRPQEEVAMLLEEVDQVRKSLNNSRYGKWRHKKKDGEIIKVETTAHSFTQCDRTVRIVIVNDITQKEIAEQQILDSQMKLKEAQAIAHIGNWDIDLVKNHHIWSDEVYKIYELDDLETQPSVELFLSFICRDDREMVSIILKRALRDFRESKIEFRFETKLGQKKYGYIEWRFGYEGNNYPVRLFGILKDITEQKITEQKSRLLEAQIREQKIQEQKNISRAIIKAQDQQRNRIAQELHDNINQILFGARFHLGIAGRKNPVISELIQQPTALISTAMEEIHLLCQKLVAPLKFIQLEEMIQDLIHKQNEQNEQNENQLKIDFEYLVTAEVPDDLKLNIYRIIQELLSNILKHAKAKKVTIIIAIKAGSIRITVEDDGMGYDVNSKRRGLGISNIIDRVVTFNGKVKLQSEVGEGSKTEISIPYQK
jgi:PAS domain S-box-containing protein